MKKILSMSALILAVAVAAPAFAGEGQCGHETQMCLDYLANMGNQGYAGVEMDASDDNSKMTITEVVDGAPADKAGLKAGDVLVAVNGISFADEGAMEKIHEAMKPGSAVTFTVSRNGKEKQGKLTLIEMPADVHARMVGEHMLQHTTTEVASN
jgi:C-terminal processing protease CtpA/Prc